MINPLLRSITVLIVDDEPGIVQLCRSILVGRGCRVLTAESAADAIRVAETQKSAIDLLITDVVMPHMDGCSLALKLSAVRTEMRVMFISGYDNDLVADFNAAYKQDCPLLIKPFEANELFEKVCQVLNIPKKTPASEKRSHRVYGPRYRENLCRRDVLKMREVQPWKMGSEQLNRRIDRLGAELRQLEDAILVNILKARSLVRAA
jgi:DNA-binding NtrC family response regulator